MWLQARVDQVTGLDIAGTSIEQCKDRLVAWRG
jgi:hypothetical protein